MFVNEEPCIQICHLTLNTYLVSSSSQVENDAVRFSTLTLRGCAHFLFQDDLRTTV